MKETSSVGDEYDWAEKMNEAVDDQLKRAIVVLQQAMEAIEAGDSGATKGIKPFLLDLHRAQQSFITERQKRDEDRRKNGGLGRGEVDFDASRSEIIDRLARLYATRHPRCVSD